MNILLVNDDGITSPGLKALEDGVRAHGDRVVTVAPANNQSGRGGAVTLTDVLAVDEIGNDRWSVRGTPADCVRVALSYLGYQPNLILSGINLGTNLGEEIYASGTIGAARLGVLRGIPSAALSAASSDWSFTRSLLDRHFQAIVAAIESSDQVLNINFPAFDGTRIQCATLATGRYQDRVVWAHKDGSRHRVLLSSILQPKVEPSDPQTDRCAILQGMTTVTYLPTALTNSQKALTPLA